MLVIDQRASIDDERKAPWHARAGAGSHQGDRKDVDVNHRRLAGAGWGDDLVRPAFVREQLIQEAALPEEGDPTTVQCSEERGKSAAVSVTAVIPALPRP